MFDWGEFEKHLLQQIPFLPKNFFRGMNPGRATNWVQDYVQNAFKSMIGDVQKGAFPFAQGKQTDSMHYDLFETHRSVIVRCSIPKDTSPYDYKPSVNRRNLRIRTPSDDNVDIPLPKPVVPSSSKATYRDGVLEIRMPKSSKKEYYRSIPTDDIP